MAAPTFVNSYQASTVWMNSTSPKTTAATVTRQIGDRLACVVISEDTGPPAPTIAPSAATGLTWTLVQQVTTASRCSVAIYTATASTATASTLTVTEVVSTGLWWGARFFHFRDSDGFGVSNKGDAADTAPSVTLTGVAADSAIVMGVGDWEAGSVASTVYRTADAGAFTSTDAVQGTNLSIWCGRYANAGAAGNKAVGITTPAAPDWSLAAVEILGTAGSAPQSITPTALASTAALGAPTFAVGAVAITPTGLAATGGLGAPSLAAVAVVSPAGIAPTAALGAPTLVVGGASVTPAGVGPAVAFGSPTLVPGITSISPSGVAPTSALGSPTLSAGALTLTPAGIPSSAAVGAPTLTAGGVTITPAGIAPTSSLGAPTLTVGAATISPAGIASTATVGQPAFVIAGIAAPAGLALTVTFGTPTFATTSAIAPTGVAPTLTIGTPALDAMATVTPAGVASTGGLGAPSLTPGGTAVAPVGIASSADVGQPNVFLGQPPAVPDILTLVVLSGPATLTNLTPPLTLRFLEDE